MNKVVLLGRLARDPEVRYSQSSTPVAVARYSVAVNRRFKREGEPDADFIPCVVFGKNGEFAEKYFKKGMMVCVCGRIQISSWDDKEGNKRYSTEVIVDEQDFAESKSSFQSRQSNAGYEKAPDNFSQNSEPEGFSAISESIDDDDLPF